jgi:hypothetical protein
LSNSVGCLGTGTLSEGGLAGGTGVGKVSHLMVGLSIITSPDPTMLVLFKWDGILE